MRKSIFIFLFLHQFNVDAQDSIFPFNEYGLSVNYSNVLKDENTENQFGFGVGMYRSSLKSKDQIMNITFGIEFNHTSQFKKNMYEGNYAYSTNITYKMNYVSIPVFFRFIFGKTTKVFIEPGFFGEFLVGASEKGTAHSYSVTDSTTFVTDFNKPIKLKSLNIGPSLGFGVKIPIGKHSLIIKLDYKYGLVNIYDIYGEQLLNRYFRLILAFRI